MTSARDRQDGIEPGGAIADPDGPVRLWEAGWALGVAATAAALLAAFGTLSLQASIALAAASAPAILGYFWRPEGRAQLGLLGLWSLGAALAAIVGGGAGGPLAAWCATPLLIGILYRRLAPGIAASAASLVLAAVATLRGAPTIPGPEGAVLAVMGLALMLGGAAATAALLRRDKPVAVTAPSADVADLERRLEEAEAARREAESSAANKARFLANMSHELRTPLNAIMGFSDIMRARMFGELSPKYGEYAELIHESGRHLLDLINDVLDMSKIEAERYVLSRETFDARDAINGALRLMRLQADDAGVHLRGLLPQDAIMVDADKRAVKQIVLNLVSNALKFTPREGSVTVTTQPRGRVLEIVVADTGVGIAPEDLERLGRPYEQAGDAQQRQKGAGLGLSLVKAFASLHGGSMSIESVLGEGAAVTVRLPVLLPVEATVDEAPAPIVAPRRPRQPEMPPRAPPPRPRAGGTVIQLPMR